MAEQHSSEARLIRCVMSREGKKSVGFGSDMVAGFSISESLEAPFMGGALTVSDSKNLINEYPIQGGETINIELKTSFSDIPIEYNFVISRIGIREVKNKKQLYTLILVSPELLVNESMQVQDPLEGNPETIIEKMLGREYLNSTKKLFSEPSRFEVKLNPAKIRPFDIIAKIIKRSVSSKTTYTGKKYKTYEENRQNRPNSNSKPIKGSAGFLFWETRRGYNFFSIDALCDTSENGTFIFKDKKEGDKKEKPRLQAETWGPYVEKIANTEISGDQRFLITKATFTSEIDLTQSLRKGKYSSLMIFFNISTGQYEEYTYKIKDSYDNMAHLGYQDSVAKIPNNEKGDLSETPSRIMSILLDHESWYNGPSIANPDDAKATDPNKFADWQKYYASQGIARAELLYNQELTLDIPGNPEICAGDKIDIRIQSKLADEQRKREPYDLESSGVYLVKTVNQMYNALNTENGTLKTTLGLCRDSYGVAEVPSNHGNK